VSKEALPPIWVFTGDGPTRAHPSGVFSSKEIAETWIAKHRLSGMLTAYPLDQGVFEWAIERGYLKEHDVSWSPEHIGRLSLAYQEHSHYVGGLIQN
jgi:hypothetical protein